MSTTPPEGPVQSIPGDNPDAQDPTQPTSSPDTSPDPDALSPEDVRTPPPDENKGSGQFAVWDNTLGQFVSGVSDKKTADKARRDLTEHNGATVQGDAFVTDGHDLETREV